MDAALRILLNEAIDYAGLFPPAGLSMSEACRNYATYRKGSEAWIVNRFVCPVTHLDELASCIRQEPVVPGGWRIAAVGTGLVSAFEELETIESFVDDLDGLAEVETFELRCSVQDIGSKEFLQLMRGLEHETFIEIPWKEDFVEALHGLAEQDIVGAKLRMGGPTANDIPPIECVAEFLQEAINLDLRFKLTAGLHHAVRRFDPGFGAHTHGFLNVLVAGVLMQENDLNLSEIGSILSEENPNAFTFTDFGLQWGEWECTIEPIEEFRELFASFGSCEVAEPLHDLRALGLLGREARV